MTDDEMIDLIVKGSPYTYDSSRFIDNRPCASKLISNEAMAHGMLQVACTDIWNKERFVPKDNWVYQIDSFVRDSKAGSKIVFHHNGTSYKKERLNEWIQTKLP